ncbi:unnamed protein product [Prorocentrum cordatum]|uniref:Uncharacterized protein n=1 Tax=Prorocentrum cordatum TaxID=2364126 RepID=A0ABN9UDT7_9DINO|nr:unnamed protein product [Polarella glacialis]
MLKYLRLAQMTLQEISPKCEYSRYLLNQLAAWCPTLKTELSLRRADQTLYVQTAKTTHHLDVKQIPERALQQDIPRRLRVGRLQLLDVVWRHREADGHQEDEEEPNHHVPPAWQPCVSPSYVNVGPGAQLEL